MGDASSDKPKLIIDDDWKEQVRAEREAQRSGKSDDSKAAQPSDTGNAADAPPGPHEIPEASFTMLVTSLVTQAAAALGQIPDPIDGSTSVIKPLAKHIIDTLAMLEQKTQGNLSDEEAQMLETVLHQLRYAFINIPDQPPIQPTG